MGLETEIDHEVSDMELNNLPDEIQKLCHGIPTYFVNYTKTSLSKNEFMDDDTVTTVDHHLKDQSNKETRFKRQDVYFTCSATETIVNHIINDLRNNLQTFIFRINVQWIQVLEEPADGLFVAV